MIGLINFVGFSLCGGALAIWAYETFGLGELIPERVEVIPTQIVPEVQEVQIVKVEQGRVENHKRPIGEFELFV